MLASMFLVFCFAFPPFHAFFSNLFLRFPTVFQEFPSFNFLIFPAVSSIFLGFFQACHLLFPSFSCFFQHFPPFSSIFCNPSPLLPRHHSSSPCKPSCSEPQRTLLSVEVRILSFFQYACLYVPNFFKALPCLHFMPFFQTFFCAPTVFPEFPSCNFLIFPTVSSISLVFPSLPFICSFSLMCFHDFPQFSPIFPLFLTIFLHFPLFFSYLFPSVFRGPRENRTPPSPNCLVVHAP